MIIGLRKCGKRGQCLCLWLLAGLLWCHVAAGVEQPEVVDFPVALSKYPIAGDRPLWEVLQERIRIEPFNVVATLLFALAITHTFMAPRFLKIAHRYGEQLQALGPSAGPDQPESPQRASLRFKSEIYHLLGEVEAVFGIWVIPLMVAISLYKGWPAAREYLAHDRNFTEPLFVVVIMTIAASRPVLEVSERLMAVGAWLGRGTPAAWWLSILTIGPLLGSFITEPAAMTISALLLAQKFYYFRPGKRLAYATLGLLFVNVSVGGTLTHFAAPPVLMVAGKWGWGFSHMLLHFGWKAAAGIAVANVVYFLAFRKELHALAAATAGAGPMLHPSRKRHVPAWVTIVHLLFLSWTVFNNHFPALFIGGFLFYLAFTRATEYFQSEVALRPALLVGFFLAGLVVHGGLQSWWIGPVLSGLSEVPLFYGAAVLTAFNDNAAITYLASLVPGFTPACQYAVVAGAVVGGGLTVIANAPNPAGQSILSRFFPNGVSPIGLLLGALLPTIIIGAFFLVFA